MDWGSLWTGLLLLTVSTFLAVIAYFGRLTLLQVTKRLERNEQDTATLRHDFEQFKQQLPFLYVLREDWIRAQIGIEKKLDEIYKTVLSLSNGGGK